MSKSFLGAVSEGKNQWWRYICSFLLILFLWQVVGSIVLTLSLYVVGALLEGSPDEILEILLANDLPSLFSFFPPLIGYLIIHILFVFFAIALFLAIKFIHKRSLRSLITGNATIRWQRIFQSFGVWLVLLTVIELVKFLLNTSKYQINFNLSHWLLLVLIAIIVTPFQTSIEELFFRGYLLQGLSLITKNKFLLIGVTGIIFAVFHFANPGMKVNPLVMGLFYFAFGVFLALITLKDNGLELALGQHAANNFLFVVLFGTKNDALPPTAIFVSESIVPTVELISFLVLAALFYYFMFIRQPSNQL